jgi:hypothetical protein
MKPSRIINFTQTTCLLAVSMLAINSKAQTVTTVWNAVPQSLPSASWGVGANWTGGTVPTTNNNAIFNVVGAPPCIIDSSVTGGAVCNRMNIGEDSTLSANTLIVTNGGTFLGANDYCALGYTDTGTMIVESGCSATFNVHLWVGLNAGATGNLILHGGTVNILGQIGLGWGGGTGFVHADGGTLNLSNWIPGPGTSGVSINNSSIMDITTGTVNIAGNHTVTGDNSVPNYVAAGRITAYGGTGTVVDVFNGTQTVVTALPASGGPPRQNITAIMSSAVLVTITYDTTPTFSYHLESTTSLTSQSWSLVPGSATNSVTGTTVTFSYAFPGNIKTFYRSVSP